MSDTPSETAGQEEPGPYVPSGLRRSTYTPPPADAPAPVWDDDALAAALEEQVRTYTSPITLPELPEAEDAEPELGAARAVAVAPEAPVAPGPTPVTPPATESEPDHVAVDPFTDPPVDDEQLLRDLEGASTSDAMQRLEEELRRRAAATGPIPIAPVVAPFFAGEPPVSPPAPGPDPSPSAPEAAAEPSHPEPVSDVQEADDRPAPWDSAPPPGSTPPPPAPGTAPPEPQGRLLPPPTDLPDVARRAELPPPPGYADDGSFAPAAERPSAPAADASVPFSWDQLLADAPPPAFPSADEENDDAVDEGDRVPLAGARPPVVAPTGPVSEPDAVEPDPGPAGAEPEPDPLPAAEVSDVPDLDVPDLDGSISEVAVADDPVPTPEGPADVDPQSTPNPVAAFPPPAAPVSDVDMAAVEPRGPGALDVEAAGAAPTPVEQRAGRAARLFWLWFAANASVVSVALGALMLGTGMSLRQAVVAAVIGIALSFIPLGFTTLAGKWNAQPTLVLSRAGFGTAGNIVPTVLAVLVRVFWGGVLLWLLGDAVDTVASGSAPATSGAPGVWSLVGLGFGIVLAAFVAAVGYGLLARVQLLLSIVAGVAIVAAAAVTLPRVHLDAALTHQDGSWLLVVGGAVLVFSFVGLVWAQSGADLARYQRPGGSGASSMLWATFGATIPPFLLIVWGALLAASNPSLAAGLAAHPLEALAGVLPAWAAVPLLIAAAVGLLSGSVLTLYSGGFALQALAPRLSRVAGVLIAAVLALAIAGGLTLFGADTRAVVRDLAVTLAVPVAAWTGIFAAEMMIRQRRFHSPSLVRSGGIYPAVRWVNLVGFVVISVVGYAFVVGGQHWLGWEGFGWRLFGVRAADPLAASGLGVVLALVLGILLPLVSAVPVIRRQEADAPVVAVARI